eukprot:TRINITY_DN9296_c0_g1_i6.p1 TRINITY_DN9296_c0_g1~~TRINITY_DN9296_c0_g1_i6.p1  ORF type:complete len:195 (-),score=31.71 TRINITY_DN9296_c0_g1_i6:103-687(-)
MSGCSSCARLFLVLSNLVLALLGLLMIGGGVWLTVDQGTVKDIVENITNYTTSQLNLPKEAEETFNNIYSHEFLNYFLIGIGGVTFLVSLFGFFGAKKESVCLLTTYILFTILLIILQVSAIAIINIQDSNIKQYQAQVGNFLNIELDNMEGSHRFQTIFFGVSSGISILFLLVSLCFCRSARRPEGYQPTMAV